MCWRSRFRHSIETKNIKNLSVLCVKLIEPTSGSAVVEGEGSKSWPKIYWLLFLFLLCSDNRIEDGCDEEEKSITLGELFQARKNNSPAHCFFVLFELRTSFVWGNWVLKKKLLNDYQSSPGKCFCVVKCWSEVKFRQCRSCRCKIGTYSSERGVLSFVLCPA